MDFSGFLTILLAFYTRKPNILDEYDYIVVGGGSAGAVMASRLSEKPCVSVLLLEAGGEPPFLSEVPGLARLLHGSRFDWKYKTIPQKYAAFGHKNRSIIWNSGKVLGGSSTINSMLYVRGNRGNYDKWPELGAAGWGFDDVLPYFKKAEGNQNMKDLDKEYHNTGGPLTVEDINYTPKIKTAILKALSDSGYPVRDTNGERQTGTSKLQATFRNQQRCSTVKAYLDGARSRKNLDILTHAFVRKILIKENDDTEEESQAYGVEYEYNSKKYTVLAKKEVILSTGTISTPQILMLSGIGPKEELSKFNIKVVADLPVGQNLQEHYGTHLMYHVKDTPIIIKNLSPLSLLDYGINRHGPLSSANQILVGTFINGKYTPANSSDCPTLGIFFMEYDAIDAKIHFNLNDTIFRKVYAPYILHPTFLCFPILLQPFSRGEITLTSIDPHDMPLINPNYYQDNRDLETIVEGINKCHEITKHTALRKMGAKLFKTQESGFPSCENENGDDYSACLAKTVVNTVWHYGGTARMGSADDPNSVVDPELRVIGVKGLRVISAAVIPLLPAASLNAPTIMIAERAYGLMEKDISC